MGFSQFSISGAFQSSLETARKKHKPFSFLFFSSSPSSTILPSFFLLFFINNLPIPHFYFIRRINFFFSFFCINSGEKFFCFTMKMKMKRKDLDQINDDFSDFSLSSPARKIRRLVHFLFLFLYSYCYFQFSFLELCS